MPEQRGQREAIKSHAAFRRLLPKLLELQEERQDLALAALANPLLALEELGYVFAPDIRRHMERLARFGEEKTQQIEEIEARLHRELGEDIDPEDAPAVARAVLKRVPAELLDIDRCAIEAPTAVTQRSVQSERVTAFRRAEHNLAAAAVPSEVRDLPPRERLSAVLSELPQRRFVTFERSPDPLIAFKGVAPVIDDLIAWREIEASRARLATPAVFRKILSGEIATPITHVRFRPGGAGREG